MMEPTVDLDISVDTRKLSLEVKNGTAIITLIIIADARHHRYIAKLIKRLVIPGKVNKGKVNL